MRLLKFVVLLLPLVEWTPVLPVSAAGGGGKRFLAQVRSLPAHGRPQPDRDHLASPGKRMSGTPAADKPVIPSGGAIVNALGYEPKLAPGALVSLFGTGLADCTAGAPGFPLPDSLCGTSIF